MQCALWRVLLLTVAPDRQKAAVSLKVPCQISSRYIFVRRRQVAELYPFIEPRVVLFL